MRVRTHSIEVVGLAVGLCVVGCKSNATSQPGATSATASTPPPASAAPGPSASAVADRSKEAQPETYVPMLQGLATRDGTKFGMASCFTDPKNCIVFPLGWRTDGRPTAMGDGKIAWAYPSNRHVCMAVDRGGSDWAELIRRDEAEQKTLSAPVSFKAGPDEIPATLRVKRLDMATARPYPFDILMWFGCYGVDPVAAANPTGMPPGKGTMLVLKLEIKAGLTFNAYAFLSDAATEEEKRDLFATLRGIRAMPGKLATHPK